MAQNTIQNSSLLYPEDIILYVAEYSTTYTSLADLSSATWYNLGALTEYSRESANASVQPASFNVEHDQVLTKEAETINATMQEMNSSIVNIMRGSLSQLVSTTYGATSIAVDVLYSGGADKITPCMLWEYASFADGRSVQTFFPYVFYVSGGSPSPKSQGTGEYRDMAFTMEARESPVLVYNNRKQYRIELGSTSST